MGHPECMALEEEDKNNEWYDSTAPVRTYPIPFRFHEASWIQVTILSADGTAVKLGENDFTVTDPLAPGDATVTLKSHVEAPTTSTVIVSRLAPSTQNLKPIPSAPLPAKDLEKALDHLAMAIRDRDSDHADTASKTLTFPIGEPKDHKHRLPMPEERKGKFIGFDDTSGEMKVRPLSEALQEVIQQAQTKITEALDAITSGLATIATAKSTTLTAIETAKTVTLTVLENALAVGTDLLARIPLFFKTGESGGIKIGEVNGHEAGSNAINLQSHRTDEWQVASGYRAIAIGSSQASGEDAITIGNDSSAGYWTAAIGAGNQATFEAGCAFGYRNLITGNRSVAIGSYNTAQAYQSVAVGGDNNVGGQFAAAYGYSNTAGGNGSLAIGHHNTTYTGSDCAVGWGNSASGDMAVAVGVSNSSTGYEASTFGSGNYANGYHATAIGRYNGVTQHAAGAFGNSNNVHAGHSFAFGYGVMIGTWGVTELGNFSTSYPAARVRADSMSGMVGLSFGYMTPAPTAAWDIYPGNEPSGTLGERMLSFRSDGSNLYIDVCISGTVRTISLFLP